MLAIYQKNNTVNNISSHAASLFLGKREPLYYRADSSCFCALQFICVCSIVVVSPTFLLLTDEIFSTHYRVKKTQVYAFFEVAKLTCESICESECNTGKRECECVRDTKQAAFCQKRKPQQKQRTFDTHTCSISPFFSCACM